MKRTKPLSDPDKQKKYDQYGADWKHAEQFEQAKKQQKPINRKAHHLMAVENITPSLMKKAPVFDFFTNVWQEQPSTKEHRRSFAGRITKAEVQLNLSDAYKTHQQTFTVNGKNIRITVPAN